MTNITLYYHDPVEVDIASSWTGLCQTLKGAEAVNIRLAKNENVLGLFEYARPDVVITVNDNPVVSIEQTQMNPSGHNIPQRFSFHVRAAEMGVPSILYYPEFSRRTYSDPNVRYLQVRVPLAQMRLSTIFDTPALSIFWPTDPVTLLPQVGQKAHYYMANIVDEIIKNQGKTNSLLTVKSIQNAIYKMQSAVSKYVKMNQYSVNSSVRKILPEGFSTSILDGIAIDPPSKSILYKTPDFIDSLNTNSVNDEWNKVQKILRKRELTLEFIGTANKLKNDSEHPWPGYLTLLDVLYLRNGKSVSNRIGNLVYRLPINIDVFLSRVNKLHPPVATFIVDCFSDLIILKDGCIAGRPTRGNSIAKPLFSIT